MKPSPNTRSIFAISRSLVGVRPTLMPGLLLALASPASADILINEVNIDPPGSDGAGNFEFIELVSTTGGVESTDGLTLLVIDSNNGGYGRIRRRWSLDGMATGANGILAIGNDYPVFFPFGPVPAGTAFGDPVRPDAMDSDEVGANGGFTLFLVSGLASSVFLDFDLDTNDNGVLDVRPWSALLDSVGFDDRDPTDPPNRETFALADVTQPGWEPENVSRRPGDFRANEAGAWFGGAFPSSAPGGDAVAFDPSRMFNGFPGASATPGLPNAPLERADLRLNEIAINPNGNDENLEFVEIASVSGESERADGHHLVIVANDPAEGDVGVIEQAWDLAGLRTGDNGLLLIGDGYVQPVAGRRAVTPFGNLVEEATAVGDPDGFGRSEIEPSNGISVLLVTGFTGSRGQDVDVDNDGVLDGGTPWEEIVDSVGFDHVNELSGSRNPTYAPAAVAPGGFFPDNLSRVGGELAANAADAWYGGDYAGDSQSAIAFSENRFGPPGVASTSARATPGAANLADGAIPPTGRILLNELLVDAPPSSSNNDDFTFEFVELISTTGGIETMTGLSLVIIDTDPGSAQIGVVREAIDLSGLSTGSNGLCVIGDSYNDLLVDAPLPFHTHREDPQGLNAGDIAPNDGVTVLVVTDFRGGSGTDLDTDDDGVFDVRPWERIEDGVGFGRIADPEVAAVPSSVFVPDTLARLPDRASEGDRSDPAAWYGGALTGDPRETAYAGGTFGPFRGGVTRGFGNHAASPAAEGTVLINEVILNPVGDDAAAAAECIEILATTLDARSLSGHALVLLDSAGSSIGDIVRIWDLSGLATGRNGLLLIGDGYAPGTVPYPVDPDTALASLPTLLPGDIGDDNAFSLLLVAGLRPTVNEGADLDAHPSAALDDDGTLDLRPWDRVVDSVGFREYVGGVAGHTGITYAEADLSQAFDPDTVARIASPETLNANAASDWYGGELAGTDPFSLVYEAGRRFGPAGVALAATPGRHNRGGTLVDADGLDPDGDERPNLLEEAMGTDPDVADTALPVAASVVADPSGNRLTFTYPRLAGGSELPDGSHAVGELRYLIEISPDLLAWIPADIEAVEVLSGGSSAGIEHVQAIVAPPTLPDPEAGTAWFMRLRVERRIGD